MLDGAQDGQAAANPISVPKPEKTGGVPGADITARAPDAPEIPAQVPVETVIGGEMDPAPARCPAVFRPFHALARLKSLAGRAPLGRVADVGWLIVDDKASLIWDAPRAFARDDPPAGHAKAVNRCPGVLDYESRIFEVSCPYDLHLRIRVKDGKPLLINAAGDNSAMRPSHIRKRVFLLDRAQWRHPSRPVIQIGAPYVFVSDEDVYINQLPPFAHYRRQPWPGLVIGGRFPIRSWPRHVNWAFEWHDTRQDLVLRRGEPWFHVRFETKDPSRKVRLGEAEMTDELRQFMDGIEGVTNCVQRTFSLFKAAQQRRPRKLLVKRKR